MSPTRERAMTHLTQAQHPWTAWCDGCGDVSYLLRIDGTLEDAARAVIKAGVSNRSGEKYVAKTEAFDALDDALEVLDEARPLSRVGAVEEGAEPQ